MNSLVFNTTASELKSSMHGFNQGTSSLQVLQLNQNGELLVALNTMSITNGNLPVRVVGNSFTCDMTWVNEMGTGTIFEKDISEIRTATMFIDNHGSNPITISLKLSPYGYWGPYFNDPNYTNTIIEANSQAIIVLNTFAHFAYLLYDTGPFTASFNAFYNAQA